MCNQYFIDQFIHSDNILLIPYHIPVRIVNLCAYERKRKRENYKKKKKSAHFDMPNSLMQSVNLLCLDIKDGRLLKLLYLY